MGIKAWSRGGEVSVSVWRLADGHSTLFRYSAWKGLYIPCTPELELWDSLGCVEPDTDHVAQWEECSLSG